MFCMACGAEVAAHLTACPNCGRPISMGEPANPAATSASDTPPPVSRAVPSSALSSRPLATPLTSSPSTATASYALPISVAIPIGSLPAGAVPVVPSALPSIGYGDLGGSLLPHDTLGRVVLATALAMALDVLAPWVVVDGEHVPLIRVGAPVLLLLAALLLPVLALRPTFRKQPLWAATPLALGALLLGAGLGVLVLLSWLASRVTLIGATPQLGDSPPLLGSNGNTVISGFNVAYSADIGLYLFLLGAVLLMVTGYQLFLAARETSPAAVLLRAPGVAVPYTAYALPSLVAPFPAAAIPAIPAAAPTSTAPGAPGSSLPFAPPPAPQSAQPLPPPAAAPTANGPILPGTAAWNQSQDAPAPLRHTTPGVGFSRPQGPPPGR